MCVVGEETVKVPACMKHRQSLLTWLTLWNVAQKTTCLYCQYSNEAIIITVIAAELFSKVNKQHMVKTFLDISQIKHLRQLLDHIWIKNIWSMWNTANMPILLHLHIKSFKTIPKAAMYKQAWKLVMLQHIAIYDTEYLRVICLFSSKQAPAWHKV